MKTPAAFVLIVTLAACSGSAATAVPSEVDDVVQTMNVRPGASGVFTAKLASRVAASGALSLWVIPSSTGLLAWAVAGGPSNGGGCCGSANSAWASGLAASSSGSGPAAWVYGYVPGGARRARVAFGTATAFQIDVQANGYFLQPVPAASAGEGIPAVTAVTPGS